MATARSRWRGAPAHRGARQRHAPSACPPSAAPPAARWLTGPWLPQPASLQLDGGGQAQGGGQRARLTAGRPPPGSGGERPAERLLSALPPPFPVGDGVGGIPPASRSLAATWQAAFAAQRTVPTTGSRERPPTAQNPAGKEAEGRGIGGRRPAAPRPDRRPRRCCFASTGERQGGAGGRQPPLPAGGDQGRLLVRGYTAGILDRHSGNRPCLPFLLAPIDRQTADKRAERSAGPQMPACPARLPAVGGAGAGCFPRPGRGASPRVGLRAAARRGSDPLPCARCALGGGNQRPLRGRQAAAFSWRAASWPPLSLRSAVGAGHAAQGR